MVTVRGVEVDKLIGESSKFRVYIGHMNDGKQAILKVAKTFEDGKVLVEDARVLNELKNFELHLRETMQAPCADAANYDLLFAKLMSSSMEESQQDRRINIMTIPETDLDSITPMSKLTAQTEVDVRSSIWVLGRLLKFYGLFEIMRVANNDDACKYPKFSENDYLIGPRHHRVVYYNYSGEIYDVYAKEIVSKITQSILGWTVFDGSQESLRYQSLLASFANDGRQTAAEAHKELYDLVRELWGIGYWPFTYRQRGTTMWKNIEEE